MDFLIRKGAEVDLVDVKGQTALYVAVVNGHLESAQILLEAGADPNGSRHHRSTPVYHASRVGRADILKALIRSVPQGPGHHCPCDGHHGERGRISTFSQPHSHFLFSAFAFFSSLSPIRLVRGFVYFVSLSKELLLSFISSLIFLLTD